MTSPLNIKDLANDKDIERIIIYIKEFEIHDEAPAEAKLFYHPVVGEIYKAVKDLNTGVIYLDIPKAIERDGGGWAFTSLSPTGDEDLLNFELIEITKENALDLKLAPEVVEQLADWLEEEKLQFSWESDENEQIQELPDFDIILDEYDFADGLTHAMNVLRELKPQLFTALSVTTIMLSLQAEGLVPQVGNNEQLLLNKQNKLGIPIAISALIDSHVNKRTIPNMVGVTKLSLLEISKLIDNDMTTFLSKMDKLA